MQSHATGMVKIKQPPKAVVKPEPKPEPATFGLEEFKRENPNGLITATFSRATLQGALAKPLAGVLQLECSVEEDVVMVDIKTEESVDYNSNAN